MEKGIFLFSAVVNRLSVSRVRASSLIRDSERWSPAPQNTRIAVVRCPACQTPAMFFLLNHKGEAGILASEEQLYIHAKPPGREALPEIVDGEGLDDPLKRAYVSAINVFNTQE